jgi:hypothetical protein
MKRLLSRAIEHRVVAAALGGSFLLVLGGWLWAWLTLRGSDQPIIVHFNPIVRINQVGTAADLHPIGIFSLLVVLVNFFLAIDLEERDRFLGKLVAAATLGFAILIFIGFSVIISVN